MTKRRKFIASNIDEGVDEYVRILSAWKVPALPQSPVPFFLALKRERVTGGPYPEVAVFELANRAMSDLVVLFAARSLLRGDHLVSGRRTESVDVALGTTHGLDLQGVLDGGGTLVGECFNVAQSFFNAKHSKARRDLRRVVADGRVVAFNRDAVKSTERYSPDMQSEFSYLLIDVAAELEAVERRLKG